MSGLPGMSVMHEVYANGALVRVVPNGHDAGVFASGVRYGSVLHGLPVWTHVVRVVTVEGDSTHSTLIEASANYVAKARFEALTR